MAPRRLWGWVRRAAYDSEVALCPRIPLADCPGCASLSGLIKVSSLLPLWRGRPGWEEILVLILSPPPRPPAEERAREGTEAGKGAACWRYSEAL